MATVATGLFSAAHRLKLLVASSHTFQAVVKADSEVEALDSVHTYASVEEYHKVPRAEIQSTGLGTTKFGRDDWMMQGELRLSFEFPAPLPDGDIGIDDSHIAFMNDIGAIVKEMRENAGNGEPVAGESHVNAVSFTITDGPWLTKGTERQQADPAKNEDVDVVWWIVFSVGVFG